MSQKATTLSENITKHKLQRLHCPKAQNSSTDMENITLDTSPEQSTLVSS